jgi:hypothetical protein
VTVHVDLACHKLLGIVHANSCMLDEAFEQAPQGLQKLVVCWLLSGFQSMQTSPSDESLICGRLSIFRQVLDEDRANLQQSSMRTSPTR